MTQWFIGDLLTGNVSTFLQPQSGSWETTINEAGSLSITVTLRDPDVRMLNLPNAATVGKSYLAVAENDTIMNAGPIWQHQYSKDDGTLQLTASGMWSYFDHRVLLPVLAAGQTPLDVETYYENVSLQTIAKRLVQQAQQHTNGNVPVILPAEVAGTETREYQGADLSLVGDALEDLTSVENGPEIDFMPRWRADRLGIEWLMRVGTPSAPQLSSQSTYVWDYSTRQPSIKGLTVTRNGSRVTGRGWAASGSSSDATMFSTYTNSSLLNQGYPLLEVVEASRSTDEQSELDAYVRELARVGSKPTEFWSFEVQADQSPLVGEYSKGDYCAIKMRGDYYIPDSPPDGYRRRITNLSGDHDGKWIKVTTGEVYSLNG
ncbi:MULTISPECIES: hypothetical protein [unclassified Curtobacterium]|uniref:hypothetical protein n=1 Tax=unclassified Curtobacterium TaxID=257496 RepID=UPI003A7FC641